MKLSFLIVYFLVLSGASESAEKSATSSPLKPLIGEMDKAPSKRQEHKSEQFIEKEPNETTRPPVDAAIKQSLAETTKQTATTKEDKTEKERLWPPFDSGWAMVFITVMYTLVALGQLWAIRRQANIAADGVIEARRTAEAAKQSADVAIQQIRVITNSERPWIMVKPDNWALPDTTSFQRYGFGGLVEWSAMNVGKSPAFLTELSVVIEVVPFPIPDAQPSYPGQTPFAKFIIPPNGKHSSNTGKTIGASEWGDMINGRLCQIFFGRVRYHDTLGEIHVTRFCSYWHLQNGDWHLEPVGPSNYIEYT